MTRLLVALVLAAPLSGWSATDLGTLPGHSDAFVQPIAINGKGAAIVQQTWDIGANPKQAAFVWRAGKRTQLRYGKSTWIDVAAINDRGDVVGDAAFPGSKRSAVAVLWRSGKPTALPSLSTVIAINDHEQVIGVGRTATGGRRALLWQHGTTTDLGTLGGGDAFPTAINERGQVIGESTTADGAEHAFVWQSGTLTDLGGLNGNNSVARAINDAGEIVGDIDSPDGEGYPVEAVAWINGTLTELGTFGAKGARALAVNARGDVLVELDDAAGDAQSGVVLRGGAVTRIRGLGGSPPANQGGPLVLTGLNDRDEIVGYGYTKRGAGRRTFLWQNGHTTLLPTRDGVRPPWGAPVALNDAGDVLGTMYIAGPNGHSRQRGVLWHP